MYSPQRKLSICRRWGMLPAKDAARGIIRDILEVEAIDGRRVQQHQVSWDSKANTIRHAGVKVGFYEKKRIGAVCAVAVSSS